MACQENLLSAQMDFLSTPAENWQLKTYVLGGIWGFWQVREEGGKPHRISQEGPKSPKFRCQILGTAGKRIFINRKGNKMEDLKMFLKCQERNGQN